MSTSAACVRLSLKSIGRNAQISPLPWHDLDYARESGPERLFVDNSVQWSPKFQNYVLVTHVDLFHITLSFFEKMEILIVIRLTYLLALLYPTQCFLPLVSGWTPRATRAV
jgi:hypothetical protein